MDVASLCPMPVGVVAWDGAEPTLTVVIKATFTLHRDGDTALAAEQIPLTLDRPSETQPDELGDASDFAPRKARADVLLVGHARSPAPRGSIAARLAVDELERRFYAIAATPSAMVPLHAAYLRAGPASSASGNAETRVGPQAPWSPERAHTARPEGRPYPPGFDFGAFNVAPRAQQVVRIRHRARIALDGLLASGPERRVRLPAVLPMAVIVSRIGAPPRVVPLRCDTLVLDTDREIGTLTFRGDVPRWTAADAMLAVGLAHEGEIGSVDRILRELPRATVRPAVEPKDLASPEPDEAPTHVDVDDDPTWQDEVKTLPKVTVPKASVLGRSMILAASPAKPEAAPEPARARVRTRTLDLEPTGDVVEPALPFVRPIPQPAAAKRFAARTTTLCDDGPPSTTAVLPFDLRAPRADALPFPRAPAPPDTALPFIAAPPAAPPAWVPPADVAPPAWSPRPPQETLPDVVAAADPPAPVAAPAAPPPAPSPEDEPALDEPGAALSLRDYVALRVRLERAPDPAALLLTRGLTAAEWRKIHRAVTRRALGDASFDKRLREALEAERKRSADRPG